MPMVPPADRGPSRDRFPPLEAKQSPVKAPASPAPGNTQKTRMEAIRPRARPRLERRCALWGFAKKKKTWSEKRPFAMWSPPMGPMWARGPCRSAEGGARAPNGPESHAENRGVGDNAQHGIPNGTSLRSSANISTPRRGLCAPQCAPVMESSPSRIIRLSRVLSRPLSSDQQRPIFLRQRSPGPQPSEPIFLEGRFRNQGRATRVKELDSPIVTAAVPPSNVRGNTWRRS